MRRFTVVALLAPALLCAQADIPTLEKQAAEFVSQRQYDDAHDKLDAALALTEQKFGKESADYGLCLLKLGDLERMIHTTVATKDAVAYYARAVHLLPNRPETANAVLFLGITSIPKEGKRAMENFQRAQTLDTGLAQQAQMWMAVLREREKHFDEAETFYKSALDAGTPDSSATADVLTLYARFLEEHGRDSEAVPMEQQIKSIRDKRPARPLPVASPRTALLGYRVGGGVLQPAVIYKVDPSYSEEARIAKISGTVILQLVVDVDGKAKNIKIIKTAGFGLEDCAAAAVTRWNFKPGEKNGSPIPVYATVEVNFRLLVNYPGSNRAAAPTK